MLEKVQFRRTSPTELRAEGRAERGATALEYSLLVGFMVFAMVAGVTLFGEGLSALFTAMGGVVDLWPH